MKIYTKTGDNGETSLFGGKRVPKDHLRIEAYGTIDELNFLIGVCRTLSLPREVDVILIETQNDLFVLGAELASPDTSSEKIPRIQPDAISRIERHIDAIVPQLTPLTNFILPGGHPAAAMIHLARTVCRRGERCAVELSHHDQISPQVIIYLNRLSDLLFIVARWVNASNNSPEIEWK